DNLMVYILEPTTENIAKAVDCIKNGGVIVCPSDCNLGLAVDPWNDDAVTKTFVINKRPPTMPLTLFISDPNEWKRYTIYNSETVRIIDTLPKAFWPSSLNIIIKMNYSIPEKMVCGNYSVSLSCRLNPILSI